MQFCLNVGGGRRRANYNLMDFLPLSLIPNRARALLWGGFIKYKYHQPTHQPTHQTPSSVGTQVLLESFQDHKLQSNQIEITNKCSFSADQVIQYPSIDVDMPRWVDGLNRSLAGWLMDMGLVYGDISCTLVHISTSLGPFRNLYIQGCVGMRAVVFIIIRGYLDDHNNLH